MRLVALAITILALPAAWFAGEQHRENCIRLDRTGCTILPWSAGTAADSRPHEGSETCVLARAAFARSGDDPDRACRP